jgi:copper chaperone CopZ
MKTTILSVVCIFLVGPTILFAGDGVRTDTISVPDMQCGMCEHRISKRLMKVEGVTTVEADAEANTVVVTYAPSKVTKAKLEKAIAEVGYDAGDTETTTDAQAKLHACCKPG